jgi:monofunctional biosynthetic peptidoglycan transglycosylase
MKNILRFIWRIIKWFLILSIASVILFRFVPIPVTPLMLMRCVQQKMDGKEMKLDKQWTPLKDISVSMPLAVIASEDQKFEEHFGFDVEAIKKAEKFNERHHGKKVKGASTISQQTAKNVFLLPTRSWIRKGFEVYFTFLIELFWSKHRIMEVYLNVIETGNGIYGVGAASQEYFHKPAERLSNSQAALIAAVLPDPLKWSPAKPTAYILRRQEWIMRNMQDVEAGDFIK